MVNTADLKRIEDRVAAGDLAGAEALCRALVDASPDDSEALNALAYVQLRRGEHQSAEQLIR